MGFGCYGPGSVPKFAHGRNEKIQATFIPDLSIETQFEDPAKTVGQHHRDKEDSCW
jgi:hypothetical protein